MALIEFKNKPDKSTAINANNLNFNFEEVMNLIYPINSIIIKADNEDYSDWLGFEWERTLVGRVPVGIDENDSDFNTVGKTGGEKKHTLTIDEMPKHDHGAAISGGTGNVYTAGSFLSGQSPLYYIPTNAAGGDEAHNNLQPYQVVAFWKRTA